MDSAKVEPIYIKGSRDDAACIMVHGFIATPLTVKPLADIISKCGITVYAPVLKGHDTDVYDLEKATYIDWIDDVRKAYVKLKNEGYKDIIVCGPSMGGLLTLNFAEMEPDIKAIIVLCAPLRPKDKSLYYRWRNIKEENRFKVFPKSPEIKNNPLYGYDSYPLKKDKDIYTLIRNAEKNLSKIKCPMLVIYSKKDHLVRAVSAAVILKKTKSKIKELLILKNSGHSIAKGPEIDKVEVKILSFLGKLGYKVQEDQ